MPTVLREGPYAFAFFSADRFEPPHVHVVRDRAAAKFWLDPVRFAKSGGYNQPELQRIERLVVAHRDPLLEAWHDYFDA